MGTCATISLHNSIKISCKKIGKLLSQLLQEILEHENDL